MKKSIAGKSLIEHVNKIHISNINEFKKIEESIKSEESSIMSQKNILSEEEFSKKINSLKKKINDYKKNRKIKIPLKKNTRSLNIGMAVAITLSEALRQNSNL